MRRAWTRAAAIALVAEAVLAPVTTGPAPASAQAEDPGAGRITMTELRDGDGRPLGTPAMLNERGQVAAMTQPGAEGERAAVLWSRGRATPVAPDGVPARIADLSDRGQVVGYVDDDDEYRGGAFSWFRRRWTVLTAAGQRGEAIGVNERGQVYGMREVPGPDGSSVLQTVVWGRDGTVIAAPDEVRQAERGFNDRGQAIVLAGDDLASLHYAIWRAGGGVTPLRLPHGEGFFPQVINEAGHVAGSCQIDDEDHACLWRDGEVVDLGMPGSAYTTVIDLNDRDEVVAASSPLGTYEQRPFVWRLGETTELGSVGGEQTVPEAINDRGEVVGWSEMADGRRHAFLWRDGEMIDLSGGAPAELSMAIDVNDRGQVLGLVSDGSGPYRLVLWTVG